MIVLLASSVCDCSGISLVHHFVLCSEVCFVGSVTNAVECTVATVGIDRNFAPVCVFGREFFS